MSTAVFEIPGSLVVKHYTAESRWKQAKEVHVYSLLAGVAGTPSVVDEITQPAFGYLTTEIIDPEPTNTAYMTRQFAAKLAEFADVAETRRSTGWRVPGRRGALQSVPGSRAVPQRPARGQRAGRAGR